MSATSNIAPRFSPSSIPFSSSEAKKYAKMEKSNLLHNEKEYFADNKIISLNKLVKPLKESNRFSNF